MFGVCDRRLMDVRNQLYELLSHCIPPEVVIKVSHICYLA
jgi:hypothetical protein